MNNTDEWFILFFEELFGDDNNDLFFYTTDWLRNIHGMNSLQFKETSRMRRDCFNSIIRRLQVEPRCPRDIERKFYVFIFYIAHVSTYRKLIEVWI